MKVKGIYLFLLLFFLRVISASGQSVLDVTYTKENPNNDNPHAGLIALSISGGSEPYSIEWCGTHDNSDTLRGLTSGIYNCKVTDAELNETFLSIPLYYTLEWDSAAPNFSINKLTANENGWAEFSIADTTSSYKIGFVYGDSLVGVDLAVGFSFLQDSFQIFMDGITFSLPTGISSFTAGNNFKISREGNSFKFYKNGLKIFDRNSRVNSVWGLSGAHFGFSRESGGSVPWGLVGLHASFGGPVSNICDYNKIWVAETTYDEDGNVIAESKVFYDQLGRVTQSQSKNETEDQVLAKENIYDKYGRLAIATLPAPISLSTLCYKNNFVQDTTGAGYTLNDFDQTDYPNKLNAVAGSVFNPNRVHNYNEGTLGWYYSDNNYLEPYVATSGFPYTRIEYSNDARSIAEKSSKPGDILRLGKGHETESYSVAAGNELDFAYGHLTDFETGTTATPFEFPYYFRNDIEGYNPIPSLKMISFDENGKQSISYSGPRGATLASAISGTADGYCTEHVVRAKTRMYFSSGERRSLNALDNNSIDIHLSKQSKADGLDISVKMEKSYEQSAYEFDPNGIAIHLSDLRNDKQLVLHTDYEISSDANRVVHVAFLNDELLNSSVYRIRIQFLTPTTRTVIGTGTPTVYVNYSFDKVRFADISYDIDYSNWALTYFDKNTGQLLKEVSPKDFVCSYFSGIAKTDAPSPQSETYEFYDASNHQFNLVKSTPA